MWGRPTLSSGPERRIYRSDDVYLSAYSFDSALFRSRGRPYSHLTEGRPSCFRVGLKSRTSMPTGIRVRFHRGDTQCPLVFVNQELFAKLKATSGGNELYTHVAPLPPESEGGARRLQIQAQPHQNCFCRMFALFDTPPWPLQTPPVQQPSLGVSNLKRNRPTVPDLAV